MERKYDKQFAIVFQAIKQLLDSPANERIVTGFRKWKIRLLEARETALHELEQDRATDDYADYRHNEEDKREQDFDWSLQCGSFTTMKSLGAGIFGKDTKGFRYRRTHTVCLDDRLHKGAYFRDI